MTGASVEGEAKVVRGNVHSANENRIECERKRGRKSTRRVEKRMRQAQRRVNGRQLHERMKENIHFLIFLIDCDELEEVRLEEVRSNHCCSLGVVHRIRSFEEEVQRSSKSKLDSWKVSVPRILEFFFLHNSSNE